MRHRNLEDFDVARGHASEALRIADEVGDSDLRAWTHLELASLYLVSGDHVGAEVETLKCRGEALYGKDTDYRILCDLRTEETHLAAGRPDQAAAIVEKIVENEDLAFHYRLESLYHLGKYLRESGEEVQAVWPLCLGIWLHTDFGHWQYQCIVQRDQLFAGRSGEEILFLLEQARGTGPKDATAAIDMEIATRFPDEQPGCEARARLDSLTPESVTPMMWDALLQFRLDPGSDPDHVADVFDQLIRRNADEYRRVMKLLDEAFDTVEGKNPSEWSLAFLERVRPVVPPPLYHHDRMEILWRNERYAEAAEEAGLFLEASHAPGFFGRFPYARIEVGNQHTMAHNCRLIGALTTGGPAGLDPAIERLEWEAADPSLTQRALLGLAHTPHLRDRPEARLRLLDRSLSIDHSPIYRAQALLAKASILSSRGRSAEALEIYRSVTTDDAYLGHASFFVAQAYQRLAWTAKRRGKLDEAAREYKALIARRDEIGETAVWGYEGLADLLLSQESAGEAETVVDAGIEWLGARNQRTIGLQLVKARILAGRGEQAAARELVQTFLSEDQPEWVRRQALKTLEEIGVDKT